MNKKRATNQTKLALVKKNRTWKIATETRQNLKWANIVPFNIWWATLETSLSKQSIAQVLTAKPITTNRQYIKGSNN